MLASSTAQTILKREYMFGVTKQVNKFKMCQGCFTHARFVSHDESIQDRMVVYSKQAAQDRLRVMQECGFMSDEDAVSAMEAINDSGLPDEWTQRDRDFNLEIINDVPPGFRNLALAVLLN